MLGWQESYLDNSNRLSARCAPGDVPALAPYDAVDHEHGRPSPGPLELAVAGGRASGSIGIGGGNAVGMRSTCAVGAGDVGC
jgi:hypothetical protein